MANAFAGNRFIIDTAAATLLNANLIQLPLPIKVKGIRWVASTTNAHTAIIQDSNSIVLWEAIETTATLGRPQESTIPMVWSLDFKVTALGSGRLYIYIEA